MAKKKVIHIVITTQQLVDAIASDKFKDHRELVEKLFFMRKWKIKNFNELKYFYYKTHMVIEGVPNVAIESM